MQSASAFLNLETISLVGVLVAACLQCAAAYYVALTMRLMRKR